MKVRLTRKLADFIDGVDLRSHQVGDVVDLPPPNAHLLIAEGWAAEPEKRKKSSAPVTIPSGEQRQIRDSINQERVRSVACDAPPSPDEPDNDEPA